MTFKIHLRIDSSFEQVEELRIDNMIQCITKYSALLAYLLLLVFPTRVISVGETRPSSWKVADRFIGFRYELIPAEINGNDVKATIRGEATRKPFCRSL